MCNANHSAYLLVMRPTRRMRNVHRQQVCLEHGAATARVAVAVSVDVSVAVSIHIAFTANVAVEAVAAKASNSLTVRCLALTYLRTRYLAVSLMANPQCGRRRGRGLSNTMPAQIQRMLYTCGRPTWGRRANRAHVSHWSLAFSANCDGVAHSGRCE